MCREGQKTSPKEAALLKQNADGSNEAPPNRETVRTAEQPGSKQRAFGESLGAQTCHDKPRVQSDPGSAKKQESSDG